jgi:2-polyprenyl-6-methoxyphenol hydroxylase-like FAD-dependent oxidoreductase
MAPNFHVAIIGGGLAGLGMALALHAHSIKCTVYERSPATGRFAGALMLSPNSLRILDKYGVYSRISAKGFIFDVVEVKDPDGNLKDRGFYLGSKELFGYDALRIYRNVLLKVLTTACVERGIEIIYDKKFSGVLSDDSGVRFRFEDGSSAQASILIAVDGISSRIRNSLFPNIQPEYNGVLVVCGSVKASSLTAKDPTESDNQPQVNTVTMFEGTNGAGAFLLGPQLHDASELLAGTQRRFPAQTREEWARLASDRTFHVEFIREGHDARLPVVQRAMENLVPGSTYIWPLQTLPKLETWWSEPSGRVILIGDAAHAMPPTSGQGANQGFEDGWTLAQILDTFKQARGLEPEGPSVSGELKDRLRQWQAQRQARLDRILELTRQMHNLRLPVEEQRKLKKGEVWESLSRSQTSTLGDVQPEKQFKNAVIEQWGWLYAPEDLTRDLEGERK